MPILSSRHRLLTIAADAPLKPADEFQYIGRVSRRVDAISKSTGTAEFGLDIDIPDLHYAVVVRPPVAGAKKLTADTAAARAMPGVTDVVDVASGVAVVAESFWQATQAASKVQVEWEETDLSRVDTATLRADYAAALDAGEGVEGPDEGDVQTAFASGNYGSRGRLLGAVVIPFAHGTHECRRAHSR